MTALKFKKQVITITMDDMSKRDGVQAYVAGDWAIHRTVFGESTIDQWSVTYVPTGLKFAEQFGYLAQAKRFVAGIPSLRLPRLHTKAGRDATITLARRTKKRCQRAIDSLYQSVTV